MKKSLQFQLGVTILELLLVMVIGSSILMLSVQQYYFYKKEIDNQRLTVIVAELFQALSLYYRAECGYQTIPQLSGTTTIIYGKLNPLYSPPPGNYSPVSIPTLRTQGYLTGSLTTSIPDNPYVDANSGAGTSGYIVQFNRSTTPVNRQVCLNTPCSGTNMVNTGQIVTWRMQVSALLKDIANRETYLYYLNADCLSDLNVLGYVEPCSANKVGDYAVWERLPSSTNVEAQATYGQTMKSVNQFTQMYTTFPITVLTDQTKTASQYYVCVN